jgi:Trk K+ transport system NAD-binding subunit
MISEGLNIFRSQPGKAIIGKALRDQDIREETRLQRHRHQRGEAMLINPDPDTVTEATDELILIATAEAEKKFMERYQGPACARK